MTVKTPKALGDYVIIEARAESAGTEATETFYCNFIYWQGCF